MGFDFGRDAETGFDSVRIDGTLGKEFDIIKLVRLLFEDLKEGGTDDLSLLLRLRDTLELGIEELLAISLDEVEIKLSLRAEDSLDFLGFILS